MDTVDLMDNLIAALQRASEPNNELDELIYEALGAKRPTEDAPLYWRKPDGSGHRFVALIPRYTSPLDDARRLIPAGLYWAAAVDACQDEPLGVALICRPGNLDDERIAEAEHEHVAIAMCIAALEARRRLT
jgi:hypothetical protein